MPTLINNTTFYDIFGNSYSKYTANAGDSITMRIDFSNCCCITSSQTQQITYSQLTGEVKITEGSWIDEGFRVGDALSFEGYNEFNSGTGYYPLTIISIPTDKIIVVTGLPAFNNATPPDKHTWQLWVNKQKEEMEFSVNWLENQNTSTTPSMNSLIDSESQRMNYTGMNSLVITNGVGAGGNLIQVGKKSGSFAIGSPRIWRFNDDNFGGATRYNYVVMFDFRDFGFLFPTLYEGSKCLKIVTKIALKTKVGDTKTSDVYYLDNGNTGVFDEAYNSDVTKVIDFPDTLSNLAFNQPTSIPFSLTVNDTSINKLEIGASYSTRDSSYNENKLEPQNKYLKILKSGLVGTADVGTVYFSDSFTNDYYTIKLDSFSTSIVGGAKTFTGVITFDPFYYKLPLYPMTDGFGKFIEARGDSDRQFYVWLKAGNTNCLLFGSQMTFEYPVGVNFTPEFKCLVNHDDNFNHIDMLTTGFNYCDDINIEDDLGFFADLTISQYDVNTAVQIEVVCRDQTSGQWFSLEKMSYDISTQNLNSWVNTFQNVSNNLPTSSAKKQSYLAFRNSYASGVILRLYYPFLIRWEYWLRQLNATSYFVSQSKNNKNWINYADLTHGRLYMKIGIIRNGVMDYNYEQIYPYNYDAPGGVTSTIELIDNATGLVSSSIIRGHIYTVRATHVCTDAWSLYPYGQITIEQEESSPRFMVSTEVDADISPSNPLIGNSSRRLDETRPSVDTIIYTCTFDATNITGTDYCFTSKISEEGSNNNPTFEYKITEDNIDKITEDAILKQIE